MLQKAMIQCNDVYNFVGTEKVFSFFNAQKPEPWTNLPCLDQTLTSTSFTTFGLK